MDIRKTVFGRDVLTVLVGLQKHVHGMAVRKGWYESGREFGTLIALVHSELSEALEEYRIHGNVQVTWRGSDGKPEGVASELADAIIRILDMAEALEIPVVEELIAKIDYNETRPHRHGGKTV